MEYFTFPQRQLPTSSFSSNLILSADNYSLGIAHKMGNTANI